jgi:hypothetical protein
MISRSQNQERGEPEGSSDPCRAIPPCVHAPVRSLIKECGLLFPRAIGQQFRNQVGELLGEDHQLLNVIEPLLSIHKHI